MAVNVPGVIAMVFFYLLVLGTGIWASFKSKREQTKSAATGMEMALLGNRNINQVVGVFTMTGKEIAAGKTLNFKNVWILKKLFLRIWILWGPQWDRSFQLAPKRQGTCSKLWCIWSWYLFFCILITLQVGHFKMVGYCKFSLKVNCKTEIFCWQHFWNNLSKTVIIYNKILGKLEKCSILFYTLHKLEVLIPNLLLIWEFF